MAEHYRFPPIEEFSLGNGLHVMLVDVPEQPALTVAMQFPGGRYADVPGLEGCTELGVGLMQSGTRQLGQAAFSRVLEGSGSGLFSEVGEEHVLLGCRMLSSKAGDVVPLLRDMVCQPRLEQRELRRLKREMNAAVDAERTETMALAQKRLCACLFGNHPAGRFPTAGSVRRATMASVSEGIARWRLPRHAVLVAAGDLCEFRGAERWEALFGGWNEAGGAVPGPVGVPESLGDPQALQFIDKPDSTQISLVLGHTLPGEDNAHRHEIALANHVLGGGGFSSRLTARVRVLLGATYGAGSHVSRVRRFGVLSMAATTLNERAGELLDAVRAVYAEFVAEGVTEAELRDAVEFARGNLSFQMEGAPHVAGKLLWLWRAGHDRSTVEMFGEVLDRIDCAAVNQAIRQYFSPESLVVCAAGAKRVAVPLLKHHGPVHCRHYRRPIS